LQLSKLETLIAQDSKLLFTLTSYVLIFMIYANVSILQSSILGIVASSLYVLINATFLGHAFFGKEAAFFRFMLGLLSLVMLIGFVAWLALIIQNLNVTWFTLVLFVVATLSSLLNRRMKDRNANESAKPN